MIKKLYGTTVYLAIAFVIAACGGDDDDETNSEINNLSDIVGLWDATEEVSGSIDEYYYGISESGAFSTYDSNGDTFNQGDNCYLISEEKGEVTHLDDNRFTLEISEDGEIQSHVIEAYKAEGELVIVFSDGESETLQLKPSSLDIETIRSMACG